MKSSELLFYPPVSFLYILILGRFNHCSAGSGLTGLGLRFLRISKPGCFHNTCYSEGLVTRTGNRKNQRRGMWHRRPVYCTNGAPNSHTVLPWSWKRAAFGLNPVRWSCVWSYRVWASSFRRTPGTHWGAPTPPLRLNSLTTCLSKLSCLQATEA